jgi:transketolase
MSDLEKLSINTIRVLAADMVEKAKSGHPGLPLGVAAIAHILFTKIMNYNSQNPQWLNRDRLVLSAGHGSALLYTMLHLSGYALTLEDLENFRQWGSLTPGHPEFRHTQGVETTTGPLGQGIANAVGIAIEETYLAQYFNQDQTKIIDYYTYVICGDGDLMEGLSAEAASFAGHLKLGKLICFYDDNQISIEGSTELAFTEDVAKRFESYGWQILRVDGNDVTAIQKATLEAQKETHKPSLILAKTHIGYGSTKQDSAAAHGSPLGTENLRLLKQHFGFDPDQFFHVPDQVQTYFTKIQEQHQAQEKQWQEKLAIYTQKYAQKAQELEDALAGKLPSGWEQALPVFGENDKMATRQASGQVLNALATKLPFLMGGSADLAPSNNSHLKEFTDYAATNHKGRNFHFGVREHAMAAIINGMALNGILQPYAATFLVFSDYMKPALRLAALMNLPTIYIFTHDSIGVGEDGPTHQPIEHLAMLRAIPNFTVLRPADAKETAAAWKIAIQSKNPVALALTRQALPVLVNSQTEIDTGVSKGAYILVEPTSTPDLILIATGSEVALAVLAEKELSKKGLKVRVVSMPSQELFEQQSLEYQHQVLPPAIKHRLVIEAGISQGWERYATDQGVIIAIDHFGASAPGNRLMQEFGFTVKNVVAQALKITE